MSEPTVQVHAGSPAAAPFFGHVNQLRDPAIHVEDNRILLLYVVAEASGIGLAEVFFNA
ncbi:hypothetical protein [Candidatus Rariloculus sp.]|uniref:hypothetical protein n=1 Tax=Candidatus Rariloculus sp. TaxID=3101265 RepID=UPI003D111514